MPFFSFILKKNYKSKILGGISENSIILEKNKKYYCKSSNVWKKFDKKNFRNDIKLLKIEKRQLFNKKFTKIIFCLPPSIGLGDAIEYGLSIKAIQKSKIFKKIGIAFTSHASNILKNNLKFKNIYPEFISEDQIKKYDGVFHFTQEINSLKLQKYRRVNIEKSILQYFYLDAYRKIKKNKKKINSITIFPISKSPIRTLPAILINEIVSFLIQNKFNVEIILDNSSLISREFEKKLNKSNIKIFSPKNIDELNHFIIKMQFGIFCDSGPLHLSKLYSKKGILISTSVSSKKLINKKDDIITLNSKYSSNYCKAPCGLTNIINFNNKKGCYDSLKTNKEIIFSKKDKIHLLNRGNLQQSYEYFTKNPVGCVKSLESKTIKRILSKALNLNI